MKLKNHTIIINDNKEKFDIFKVIYFDNNLSICITKNRFLNLFKKPIFFEDDIRFTNMSVYLECYIDSYSKKDYYSFIEGINKKYFIFGYYMDKLISFKELNEVLENYKIMNLLTKNV